MYLLGPCYCKDKRGDPHKNDIMCITSVDFEQLTLCDGDESCIGPKTPDKAMFFSRANFCSKGELVNNFPLFICT